MNEMIERVLEAMTDWEMKNYPGADRRGQVRAVIGAMREPTPEMIEAAAKAFCHSIGSSFEHWYMYKIPAEAALLAAQASMIEAATDSAAEKETVK
jgi:hypothetical protein